MLTKIDAVIQSGVDAAAFFLMRRFGWRKPYIRYALYALGTVSMIGGLLPYIHVVGFNFHVIFNAALAAFYIIGTQIIYREEVADDESATILSPFDAARARNVWFFKCVWVFLLASNILDIVAGPSATETLNGTDFVFVKACLCIFDLAFLAESYLVKTPKQPPPVREREPAGEPIRVPVRF